MSRTMPAVRGLRAESVTRRLTTPARRRRGGERRGAGSLLPATTFTAGAAVLISDYAWLPGAPTDYVLFWLGILACFASVAFAGLRSRATERAQVIGLSALGAVLWLPYFLRSPRQPIFVDELFHFQALDMIAARGHTKLPVTL